MPHDTHEALVVPFMQAMNLEFARVPLSRGPYTIAVEAQPNATVDCGDSKFIPDLCVRVFSMTGPGDITAMRDFFFLETAFSQSEAVVMKKLHAYIEHHPHTIAVLKIKVKETPYKAPSKSPLSGVARRFIGESVLSEEEFRPSSTPNSLEVTRDEVTWINVTGVELQLWLRTGEAPIDFQVNPDDAQTLFATGVSFYVQRGVPDFDLSLLQTLYPTRSTAALDALFVQMMQKFKELFIQYVEKALEFDEPSGPVADSDDLDDEERQDWLDDVSSWVPGNPPFNWRYICLRLVTSMWKTAHSRYKDWHNALPKRPLDDDSGSDPGEGDSRPANGSGLVNKRLHLG